MPPGSTWQFGQLPDGTPVEAHRVTSATGLELTMISLGATIVSLRVPGHHGTMTDVVLGFETLEAYLRDVHFIGCTVGRVANRIAKGRFELDGVVYQLAANEGTHHLHGGPTGFHRARWQVARMSDGPGVRCVHVSPDGDSGYPGRLEVTVTMRVEDHTLVVECDATTTASTPVNLTNHSYFNLAGMGDIHGHRLMVHADAWTPVDSGGIPTGETRSVDQAMLELHHKPPRLDHNFVLRGTDGLRIAARLDEPTSGRSMEIATTQPCLQVYAGQHLDGRAVGKGGRPLGPGAGLCLETQHPPDAINQPSLADIVLRPGARYRHRTEYRFRC